MYETSSKGPSLYLPSVVDSVFIYGKMSLVEIALTTTPSKGGVIYPSIIIPYAATKSTG